MNLRISPISYYDVQLWMTSEPIFYLNLDHSSEIPGMEFLAIMVPNGSIPQLFHILWTLPTAESFRFKSTRVFFSFASEVNRCK
jgi:hypothetical protein